MKYKPDRIIKAKRIVALVNHATVSIDQAIAAVSMIGGTIFDIKLKEVEDKPVWRVKLLRGGDEEVKVYVDATSGRITEAKSRSCGNGAESCLVAEANSSS